MTYAGTISTSGAAARSVLVTNRPAGRRYSAARSREGGLGIRLDNNDNSAVTFSGGLARQHRRQPRLHRGQRRHGQRRWQREHHQLHDRSGDCAQWGESRQCGRDVRHHRCHRLTHQPRRAVLYQRERPRGLQRRRRQRRGRRPRAATESTSRDQPQASRSPAPPSTTRRAPVSTSAGRTASWPSLP